MATHTIHIDRSKRLHEEPHTGHNRWHPDIAPVLRVDPGDTVVMETPASRATSMIVGLVGRRATRTISFSIGRRAPLTSGD